MAASYLSKPGSDLGPCGESCKHRDCASTRAAAAGSCRLCGAEIGYENLFYKDPEDEAKLVHAECFEKELDR